ncbi:MAG TPA: hypothetical protein VGK38_00850 [Prolixibacteraceae bacterium]
MKNKNFTSIALIIIAVIAVSIICGFAVFNNSSSNFAYEIGRSAGKLANPYLFGLGITALVLVSIQIIRKKI